MNNFYVYQHRRLDENTIFYVGKGCEYRHTTLTNRNKYWHNIVNKCGFSSEILYENLDEEFALLIEIELIDKYRRLGFKLTNLTDGGEGVSGYKHTEETRKKIGEKSKNRIATEETKKKLSNTLSGKKRKNPFSEEHRKKLSEAAKKQKRIPFSEETKHKISSSLKGKKRTLEQRERISIGTKIGMEKVKNG